MIVQQAIYPQPPFLELALRHPQVALCLAHGIPLRPNIFPLSVELQNAQIGQPQPASFSEVISQYSIFTGVTVTIDPTNDADGNPVKYINDAAQALVTGVTMTLQVQGRAGVNYFPIPEETPVQGLPPAFAPLAWVWRMVNPENLKATFTVATDLNASPFTVWCLFAFAVPDSDGDHFLQLPYEKALTMVQGTAAYRFAQGQAIGG